ncbi:MAG TPA: transglutaminaseTgpA domain-containing protein [Anaerolineaceae bacterium]|nr:transglutaminaseTgpA domain-containing protein [Anaerolineaceae bacterium]
MNKPVRYWDFWAALILLFAQFILANRFIYTEWTSHLVLFYFIILPAAAAGLTFGQSRFRPLTVGLMSSYYAVFNICWIWGAAVIGGEQWSERMINLVQRVGNGLFLFINDRSLPDPFFALFVLSFLLWMISFLAGYYLTRHAAPWKVILPSLLVMLVIDFFDPSRPLSPWFTGGYLLLALLLLGRITYLRYRGEWESRNAFIAPETGWDFGRTAATLAALFIIIIWNIPPIQSKAEPLNEFWDTALRPFQNVSDRFSDMFSSFQGKMTSEDSYGVTMPLGDGASLNDELIFTVTANQSQTIITRFYWRARSYDTYDGGDWSSTVPEKQEYNASGFPFKLPDWTGRQDRTFTFTVRKGPVRTLYTSGMAMSASRGGEAAYYTLSDGSGDLLSMTASAALYTGDSYQVRASLSAPTVKQLRDSGNRYTEAISRQYLTVPPDIQPALKELAESIVKDLPDNPYDRTLAVTNYLRENIQYAESFTVERPVNVDPVIWFLFDVKQGYCNYYATAEVLLLRTLGIPARIAVGYAPGDYDKGTYVVRQRHAHAWPEIYFNGVGWVEFEPTVSYEPRYLAPGEEEPEIQPTMDPIAARGGHEPTDDEEPQRTQTPPAALNNTPPSAGLHGVFLMAGVVFFAALVSFLIWFITWGRFNPQFLSPKTPPPLAEEMTPGRVLPVNGRRRPVSSIAEWVRRWSSLPPFERLYKVLEYAIQLMGKQANPAQTPAERAAQLAGLLPQVEEPLQVLLAEYHQATYSTHPADLERATQAAQTILKSAYGGMLRRIFTNQARRASMEAN